MPLAEFVAAAGDGMYPEGDFDDAGLRRNLARRGFSFDQVRGEEHQSLVRRVGGAGNLALFNGANVAGCILHLPTPRHWVALVPPSAGSSDALAALLCDSLWDHVYGLTADEVGELFALMACRHDALASSLQSSLEQERQAAEWSVYLVSQ